MDTRVEKLLERILKECEVEVLLHPEDLHPKDCFDECLKDEVERIVERSKWNDWAWCIVEVKVKWKGLKASSYLGGCSYEGEKEFMECSGEDMKWEAAKDIAAHAISLTDQINEMETNNG